MQFWTISDMHLWHENIKIYCNRPDGFEELILANWDRMIGPDDIVIDMGDDTFRHNLIGAWLGARPGRKVRIRGNHDSKSLKWPLNNGFIMAFDSFTMYKLIFTHRPLSDDQIPEGHLNVHGHTHDTKHEFWDDKHWAFSLERQLYMPVKLDNILGQWHRRLAGITEPEIIIPAAPEGLWPGQELGA